MSIDKYNIAKAVHDHILGITSEEDERELQRWLDADVSHRREFERLMSRDDLSRRYRQYAAVDCDRAWQSFRRQLRHTHHRPLWPKWAAAAVLVACVAIGTVVLWQKQSKQDIRTAAVVVRLSPAASKARSTAIKTGRQQGQMVVGGKIYAVTSPQDYARILAALPADEEIAISTSQGREYWLTLSDGTQVHLDNRSTLKYPTVFAQSHREVSLTGTAWFRIAKSSTPFTVSTADGIIIDRGTEFMVNTRGRNGHTDVVLLDGKVGVSCNGGAEIPLKPGQRAGMAEGTIRLDRVSLAVYRAWNEGEFLFQDEPLGDVMDVVRHWYDVDVSFTKEEYSRMKFTGSADRYGTLTDFLKAVELVTGLKIRLRDNQVIIGE